MISWELPTIVVLIGMHCLTGSYTPVGLRPSSFLLLLIVFIQRFD